ncbi:hypothetical protein AN958_03061 [Leucoagaricus sp. SymC.cos]|nr:hypothetical protein AN958_03061 [Leucoagaricus sp. SymC.cos]
MHKCTCPRSLPKHFPRPLTWKFRQNGKFSTSALRLNERQTRSFSTSRTNAQGTDAKLAQTRHEALTLQHKTENILEPVFKVAERPSDILSKMNAVSFWRDVLSDTFENLSSGAERPARVVVLSLDEWSGAQDLVTALLDEPLSSNQAQEKLLQTRWKDVKVTGLTISTNPVESTSKRLSSSYLKQFSVPLEITEHRAPISQTFPSTLFKADVPIIVFNPLTTPLSFLRHLTIPSHTIFVASSTPDLNDTSLQSTTQAQLFPSQQADSLSPQRLLFIDPSRALSAIQTFRSNPTSALAIQQYQDDFIGSGVSLVTQAIRDIVDSGDNTSSPSTYLRNKTAIIQLNDALEAFYSNVQSVQRSLDNIREGVSQLTGRIEEAKARIPNDILGPAQGRGEGGDSEKDVVSESLRLASREMKAGLERLSWWKTIWRVDEVSGIVGGAVDRVWCKDLEQKLILQTGRLLTLQQEFTKSALSLVHTQQPTPPPPSPPHPLFTAELLKNSLSQITSSRSYTVTPSTLTTPITKRKLQLLEHPTTRLHLKAQRLLLTTSTTVALSSWFTWAGWMGYLSQSTETVSAVWSAIGMGMDPLTGIGAGLLGMVGSLRWAVGKWEKEKRKWWRDWERIGKGLGRDLKATLDTAVEKQAVVVADAACEGLKGLCEKRQKEVDKIRDYVVQLQAQLKDITSRTKV